MSKNMKTLLKFAKDLCDVEDLTELNKPGYNKGVKLVKFDEDKEWLYVEYFANPSNYSTYRDKIRKKYPEVEHIRTNKAGFEFVYEIKE